MQDRYNVPPFVYNNNNNNALGQGLRALSDDTVSSMFQT
jgi:hypothetical protein